MEKVKESPAIAEAKRKRQHSKHLQQPAKKFGLETKPEDFKSLTAADLNKLAEEFGGVKLSASAVQYPAGNVQTEKQSLHRRI